MIKVALKGLAGRKVRALLTALAVVIGVSMVSGTYVLTDTIKQAFDGIFTESYQGTDAVISGRQLVDFSSGGRATVPAATLDKVRALPEVEAAAGGILDLQGTSNSAKLLDRHGKVIGRQGETYGVGIDAAGQRFSPLKLKAGAWPHGSGEIVLDAGTAAGQRLHVGDSIRAAGTGPVRPYKISGVARFGSVDSLGGSAIAVFDVPTAQALFDKHGRYDSIDVAAKDGVSPARLVREIRPLLGRDLTVQSGDAQAAADAKDTNDALKYITYFLLGFGGIALFVGAFVILNTLSITVAQRSREFATLRTLGASRRQVLRSVVLEGLVVGVVASVIGLFLGLGIAKGMNALFVALGIDLPQSGMVLAGRTVIVSMLVGTVVTVVASLVPARRATRVPPITAVREGSTAGAAPSTRRPYGGLATVAAALAALGVALYGTGVPGGLVALLLGGGVLALFIGIAMLAPRLVKPIAAFVGLPAAKLGGTAGRLARENSVRNPGRTASTAAALMIGLALVTVVAMLGAGLRESSKTAVAKQVQAGYVVVPKETGGSFGAGSDAAVARAADVSSGVRMDQAKVGKDTTSVSGIDPATIGRFYRFDWQQGSLAGLGEHGALVTKGFADGNHLKVGSPLSVVSSTGKKLAVTVRGVYDAPAMDQLLGDVSLSQRAFDGAFSRPQNAFTFADAGSQVALARAVGGYPDAKLQTKAQFVTGRSAGLSKILSMLYVLLGFSVIVSLFGMVNTLVLAVYERTRELGMLRAVGMTRRQARRMVRHESVITALIGAGMGIPLGIFLATLVTQALSKYGIGLALPVPTLAAFTVVAIAAGVLAAIAPARRASRLDVLSALHYE